MKARRLGRAPGLLLALLAAPPGAAESPPDLLTEQDFLGEFPAVLTPTRLAQPARDSPTSITVLDRRAIVASGARDVAELMRLVPGFQVEYVRANKPVVTYHGLADDFARRLQVLVDGRSVYTPLFGGVLWSSLPLSVQDIERIEVIRGPNAATYGPNSFAAVVNIITRHAAAEAGDEASATTGQRGQRDAFARGTGAGGDDHYRMSLEYEEDDGFEGEPDGRRLARLAGRYDAALGADDALMIQAGSELAELRIGDEDADLSRGDVDIPREQAVRTAYAQVEWTHRLAAGRELSLQYYANYDRWLDDNTFDSSDGFAIPSSGLTDPSVRVDLNARSLRHDLELVYTDRLGERLRVVAGTGARHESVESRWLFGTDEPQENTLARAFGHAEYRPRPGTTLHLGALVEDNDLVGTETSPRLALVQATAPHHRLRLGVSWATRTPSLVEQRQERFFVVEDGGVPQFRFYTDFTEAGLAPERMRAVELGYRIAPPGRRWGADLKLFREHVDDLIVEVDTAPPPPEDLPVQGDEVHGFVNGFSARLEGVEAELTLYPGRDLDLRLWGSRASVEQARAVNDEVRADHVASVPRTTAGMMGIYRLAAGRTLSLDYYYIDRMSWVDKSDTTRTERLDLQYREQWLERLPSAFVALRLENLLGEYPEYDDDNVTDTRLSLQIGATF